MSTRRRIDVAIAVVAALGIGFGAWRWLGRSACDGGEVDELVAKLEAGDPHFHPRWIAEGLPEVCELPEFAAIHIEVLSEIASASESRVAMREPSQAGRERMFELFGRATGAASVASPS